MMKLDQCPYCGADTDMQKICPSCGRTLSEETENDPFASAMAQERRVKEQQKAMREKYRSEMPEQPRPAQPSAEQKADSTEDHTAEEPDTPAPAAPPKKKSSLPYTLAFCGLLLAICGSTLILPELTNPRPKKNDSYALYSKGKDLWLYTGKKRKPVLISEATLPLPSDLDGNDGNYMISIMKKIYDETVFYDEERNLLWYPDGIAFNPADQDMEKLSQPCRLLCRNLKTSEETVITDSLSLNNIYENLSRLFAGGSMLSQVNPEDEYINLRPSYLVVGDLTYYIDGEQRLMRSDAKGGTPETVAESVYRFWKAEDGQTVLFLSAEEEGKAFINPQNGKTVVYSDDVEDNPVIFNLDKQMISGSIIRSSTELEAQFEMSEVPFSLCQVKNGEQPKTVCSGLSGWSIPQTNCANFIMYSVPEDEKNTYSFRRYDTNTQKETTLFLKDDAETGEKWETYSLCCYPNGDCYFAGGNRSMLSINPDWFSSYHSDEIDTYRNSFNIFEPIRNSDGIWFYDAEKDECTFLFSPIDSIQSFSGVGSCCRSEPFIIGSSGLKSTIFRREQQWDDHLDLPEHAYAAAFSPDGNYLLCGTYSDNFQKIILKYTDLKNPGTFHPFDNQEEANIDVQPFLIWHTDPDTGRETALLEKYTFTEHSSSDSYTYTLPDLHTDGGVLTRARLLNYGADAFGRIYAINNFTDQKQTCGTLNRLDKDAWTPIAQNVTDCISVSKDALYLLTGETDSELQFMTDSRTYLLDRNISILLKADS